MLHNSAKRVQSRSSASSTDIFLKKSKNKNRKFRKKIHKKLKNLAELCQLRLKDLDSLLELRKYNIEGCRERYLFLYRLFLKGTEEYTSQEVLNILYNINQTFIKPLRQREVKVGTRSADKKDYYFSNKKIIEWLNISPEEQNSLNSIISYAKSIKEKKEERNAKRRKTGLTRSEWENSTRRKGRPWEKLNISRSTWERYAARDRAINEKARRVLSCVAGNLVSLYIITERFIFLYLGLRLQRFEQGLLTFNQEKCYISGPGFYNPIPP